MECAAIGSLLEKKPHLFNAESIYVYKNLYLIIEYYVQDHYCTYDNWINVKKREKIHCTHVHFMMQNADAKQINIQIKKKWNKLPISIFHGIFTTPIIVMLNIAWLHQCSSLLSGNNKIGIQPNLNSTPNRIRAEKRRESCHLVP